MKQPALRVLAEVRLTRLLKVAKAEASRLVWRNPSFSLEKAACLSLFAELAYLFVTEEEYRNHARSKVVPCWDYRFSTAAWPPVDTRSIIVRTLLEEGEAIQFDVIETAHFVALVFLFNKVTVIAIRGTADWYDGWRDVSFWKRTVWNRSTGYARFHAGFFNEAALLAHKLLWEFAHPLRRPIVTTGHSLGGAISAIIRSGVFTDWDYHQNIRLPPPLVGRLSETRFAGSYNFGTPRIGNDNAAGMASSSFNIINLYDPIGRVPLKLFGYRNHIASFDARGDFWQPSKSMFAEWFASTLKGRPLREHRMELYQRRVRRAAGFPIV